MIVLISFLNIHDQNINSMYYLPPPFLPLLPFLPPCCPFSIASLMTCSASFMASVPTLQLLRTTPCSTMMSSALAHRCRHSCSRLLIYCPSPGFAPIFEAAFGRFAPCCDVVENEEAGLAELIGGRTLCGMEGACCQADAAWDPTNEAAFETAPRLPPRRGGGGGGPLRMPPLSGVEDVAEAISEDWS